MMLIPVRASALRDAVRAARLRRLLLGVLGAPAPGGLVCSSCGCSFTWLSRFRSHLARVHGSRRARWCAP